MVPESYFHTSPFEYVIYDRYSSYDRYSTRRSDGRNARNHRCSTSGCTSETSEGERVEHSYHQRFISIDG